MCRNKEKFVLDEIEWKHLGFNEKKMFLYKNLSNNQLIILFGEFNHLPKLIFI